MNIFFGIQCNATDAKAIQKDSETASTETV
jgi:hypothetical protein